MKNKKTNKFIRIYALLLVISLFIFLSGVFLISRVITVRTDNGDLKLSNWPKNFTQDFSEHITDGKDETIEISNEGNRLISEESLWLQVLDENGNIVFTQGNVGNASKNYSLQQLLDIDQNMNRKDETVFIGTKKINGKEFSYLIGFPIKISRITMFLNGDNFNSGKSIIFNFLIASSIFLLFVGFGLSVWMTRQLKKIISSMNLVANRMYDKEDEEGLFSDVYQSLNELEDQLRHNEEELINNDLMREEWITNVTHDLKTPLSPIKGYAELLSDTDKILSSDTIKRYGEIMLKNVDHCQSLIDDLKLTYQLKNQIIPLNKEEVFLDRYMRELIIDVLNDPSYSDRVITLKTKGSKKLSYFIDTKLLKRAFENIIFNSFIHNKDSHLKINLKLSESIFVTFEDDGAGMKQEDVNRLFERYYRGKSSQNDSIGTGLGLTISKQIIELHGGSIEVFSKVGVGTKIIIRFPIVHDNELRLN
ncbi:sensor histidine kinase [Enterococcus avium]